MSGASALFGARRGESRWHGRPANLLLPLRRCKQRRLGGLREEEDNDFGVDGPIDAGKTPAVYRTFAGGPSSKRWAALFQISGTWHVAVAGAAGAAPRHWSPLLPSQTVLPRISTPRA